MLGTFDAGPLNAVMTFVWLSLVFIAADALVSPALGCAHVTSGCASDAAPFGLARCRCAVSLFPLVEEGRMSQSTPLALGAELIGAVSLFPLVEEGRVSRSTPLALIGAAGLFPVAEEDDEC